MRTGWLALWSPSQWNYRLAYNLDHWWSTAIISFFFVFDEDIVISNSYGGRVELRALSMLYARAVIWLDYVSTLEGRWVYAID